MSYKCKEDGYVNLITAVTIQAVIDYTATYLKVKNGNATNKEAGLFRESLRYLQHGLLLSMVMDDITRRELIEELNKRCEDGYVFKKRASKKKNEEDITRWIK